MTDKVFKILQSRCVELNYHDYLLSDYWKEIRKVVLSRDGNNCVMCGSKDSLHVHHITYEHYKNEHNNLSDLITLCKNCHVKVHGAFKMKRSDFDFYKKKKKQKKKKKKKFKTIKPVKEVIIPKSGMLGVETNFIKS
jgi:5-methylcytosine-specific restriction endonuclease McrA